MPSLKSHPFYLQMMHRLQQQSAADDAPIEADDYTALKAKQNASRKKIDALKELVAGSYAPTQSV